MSYVRTNGFYVYGDGSRIYCHCPHLKSKHGLKLDWQIEENAPFYATGSLTEMIEHLKLHLGEEQKTLFVQQEIVKQLLEAIDEMDKNRQEQGDKCKPE